MPDGKTRVLGYTRALGKGGVAYIALGHCHSPRNDMQPFVDTSVNPSGTTPMLFRGSWETEFIREVAEQRDRMGYRRELWDVADARIQPGSRRRESGAGVSLA